MKKNCPFCGSDNVGVISIFNVHHCVGCKACGLTGPQSDTEQGAKDLWDSLHAKMCRSCITRPWGQKALKRMQALADAKDLD